MTATLEPRGPAGAFLLTDVDEEAAELGEVKEGVPWFA